ncbi:hypothetical protein ACFSZS_03365 [Seohaeicola zhoushanensis]
MADFGNVMFKVGTALETDRLDRQMQRLQVDITRDLNDLRLKTEQIGDPDAAETAWKEGKAALLASYNQAGADGRARVDPKNMERFGLAFDDLANRHAFSLGSRTLELRRAERQANYMAYTHEAAKVYASGDEQLRDKTLADLDAMIDADVAAGRYDAAEGQKRKQDFRSDGDNARAINMISADPEAFQKSADAGQFPGIPADNLARYRAQAQNAIEANAKAAQVAADKAAKERAKALDDRLDEIIGIAGRGAQAVDEKFLNDPEVLARPKAAEAKAALALRDEGKLILHMTPAELKKEIASEKAGKKQHEWQTDRLKLLEDTLAKHEAGYGDDYVAYAQELGRDVPPLLTFDPAKPGNLAQSLRARTDWAEQDRVLHGAKSTDILSDAERESLEQFANKSADPAVRLALANELVQGLGKNAAAEARKISDDPALDWVTDLVRLGAPKATQRAILDGQSKLDDKTAISPSRNDAIELFHEVTGGEFRDLNQLSERVLTSAIAIYAGENPDADPASIDNEAFERAVNRALGGNGEKVGGLQELGGIGSRYTVPLPVNIGRDEVEHGFDAIEADLSRPLVYDDPKQQGGPGAHHFKPVELKRLVQASVTGKQVPDFGDPASEDYAPRSLWGQLRIEAVWPDGSPTDSYLLYRQQGSRRLYLQDTEGKPFVMSLNRLREATQ